MSKYKLIDKQSMGTMEDRRFSTKKEMRQNLISYHEIDWDGENDIQEMSLNDMLDYGEWDFINLEKNNHDN